jgi:hypothetical protein
VGAKNNAVAPLETGIPVLAPKLRWNQIEEQLQMEMMDKTAVQYFVMTTLFPKLKFITGSDVTMEYLTADKTVCKLVMTGCNQVHSKAGMVWWETAKKQTMTAIKRQCNDATKNMKSAFMGKLGNRQIQST